MTMRSSNLAGRILIVSIFLGSLAAKFAKSPHVKFLRD
jgi:hypothetical protein